MKPPHPELRRLTDRLFEGDSLARTEVARLEELLEDSEARAWYLAAAQQEAMLPLLLKEFPAPSSVPAGRMTVWQRSRFLRTGIAAAVALLVFAGGLWTGTQLERPATTAGAAASARITGLVGAEWADGAGNGVAADTRRLRLRSGLAELIYDSGVKLTLEGPVDFAVTGSSSGKLQYGKLVAQVPKGAEGFQVNYPEGRVVDLGTEFALDYSEGGRTEIAVFEGEVELHREGRQTLSLLKDQALLLNSQADAPTSIPLNHTKFVRTIPNRDFPWEVLSTEPSVQEFDVTHLVWKAGDYRAIFKWLEGPDAVAILSVELCRDGVPVVRADHGGHTGDLEYGWVRDNLFSLPLPAAGGLSAGQWTVRATMAAVPRTPEGMASLAPIRTLGVLHFEEGPVSRAAAADFLGTWTYEYRGGRYQRTFLPDGGMEISGEGVPDRGISRRYRWTVTNGVLSLSSPDSNFVERHVLRSEDTMIFVSRPYSNARRAKKAR